MKPELKILRRLFVIQIFLVGANGNVTKTTAINCDDNECLKPTSQFISRRVFIEDTTRHTGHYKRLKPSNSIIWKWDYRCQMQVKKGNCINKESRFYYDIQSDKCIPFTYTGCEGNWNNFKTQIECERRCKGASSMSLYVTEPESYCILQPNSGTCLDLIDRFYFNVDENRCNRFVYGGCGGNENNFNRLEKCMVTCLHFARSGIVNNSIERAELDDSSSST